VSVRSKNAFDFSPVKCRQPHETADTFAASVSLVSRIGGAEGFEISVVKAYAIVLYQKAAYLGVGPIRIREQILCVSEDLDFNPAILFVRVLDCMDGIDDRLK